MKVMFAASSLSYGGAEKMLAFVANGLSKRNHAVSIANLLEEKEEVQSLDPNIKVGHIQARNVRYVEKIDKILKLREFIQSDKPDVIVAFKSTPAWIACLAAKHLRIPVVFSERGDPYVENLKRWRTYPYWKLINHAAGAVFQTYGAKEYFEKGLQERSAVIPNPVAPVLCGDQKGDLEDKAVVSFGRFENFQKRYDVMIDAFSLFHKTHPEYILKLYGTGEDEQAVRQWVNDKDLQDAVQFLGYAGKPYKEMKPGNIFLITSDFEGISNAMLEAMAAGFPVVSTDSSPGGARMVIQDRENGLLAPVGDSKKVAEALSEFADDKQLRNKCAMNAKDVVIRFAPEKIMDQWENYLLHVCDKNKVPGSN